MMRSASGWPRAASRENPKVRSAAALNSTTFPSTSIVMIASRAASKSAGRLSTRPLATKLDPDAEVHGEADRRVSDASGDRVPDVAAAVLHDDRMSPHER